MDYYKMLTNKNMETPFNMIILGMTGCGKTHYLLKMLEKNYTGHFDYIFLVCPTYEYNKTYQEWKYKNDKRFVVVQCGQDGIDHWLKLAVLFAKGTNSLIILDDCASSQVAKNRVSELVKLAFSARHYGLSTIVITQQLTSITKPYRENISKLVTFYNPKRDDMEAIFNDYLDVSKEKKKEIKEYLRKNEYSRLEVLLRHPYTYKLVNKDG